jgi:hypothetical protein
MKNGKKILIALSTLVVIFLLILIIITVLKRPKPIITPGSDNQNNPIAPPLVDPTDPYRRHGIPKGNYPDDPPVTPPPVYKYYIKYNNSYVVLIENESVLRLVPLLLSIKTKGYNFVWNFSEDIEKVKDHNIPVTISFTIPGGTDLILPTTNNNSQIMPARKDFPNIAHYTIFTAPKRSGVLSVPNEKTINILQTDDVGKTSNSWINVVDDKLKMENFTSDFIYEKVMA